MTNNEIVAKLWNLCNVLRDDGITYQDYVTELTYILFLKMAKETGAEKNIPEEYRWDKLSSKDGIELKRFYATLLQELGEHGKGKIQHIYSGASSKIDEPANLKKIITSIDDLDWYSAKEEGLGNLYEGLLEKNANEKKSGAGQYFTPRALIDVMTELIAPQPGEKCNDPACGTYGFMIAADRFVKNHTNDLFDLSEDAQHFQKYEAFTGAELVHETHRLDKKAGFISKKWLPVFANYRRDGYDFYALYDDGKAPNKHKKIMVNFIEDNADSEIYSNELKKQAGFGKDGEKGFDGAITNLMMQTYLCNCDFKKRVNKKGIEYGWDVAVYSSIEHIYGYDYVTSCYKDNPQDSWKQLVDYMHEMYPEATDKQIRKILK